MPNPGDRKKKKKKLLVSDVNVWLFIQLFACHHTYILEQKIYKQSKY